MSTDSRADGLRAGRAIRCAGLGGVRPAAEASSSRRRTVAASELPLLTPHAVTDPSLVGDHEKLAG